MTLVGLQIGSAFDSSDSQGLLRRGTLLPAARGDIRGRAIRWLYAAKTFLLLTAAAIAWICTAVFVACPDTFTDTSRLAPSFFGVDGSFAIFTHASVLVGLVFADILIAICILNDQTMKGVILSRAGFSWTMVSSIAFLILASYGVRHFSGYFESHKMGVLVAGLVLVCVPRGLSYWKPQGTAQDVPHSVGS